MLTSMLLVAWCALPGPVAEPFSVAAAQQRFVELDGVLFARQGTSSVSVDARGVVAFTGAQRVAFEVVEVRRDGAACATDSQWRTADGVVAKVARACGVSETWATRDDGVEHSLVVDRAPPGRGPLRVKVATQGAWHHADAQGHVFAGPGAVAPLRYGNAFVVRGGAKFPIAVEHVEGALELVVPAELVDAPGAFPLHVDPLVSGEQWLDLNASRPAPLGFSNESQPALAWSPESGGQVLVAWVDDRRLVQTDVFGALLRRDGTVVSGSLPLVVGAGNERKPALAWNPVTGHFVLAWEERLGVGWQEFDLAGRPVGIKHPIAGATSPSLALQPDAAVGLAYATLTTLTVRTLDEVDGGAHVLAWAGGEVTRSSLSVSAHDYALAVEAVVPQSLQSHVWVFGGDVLRFDTTGAAANHTDPVVMFGSGAPWVAYTSLGRVVAKQVGTANTTPIFTTSFAPRLFLADAGLTLGWRSGATLVLRTLEAFSIDTSVPLQVNDWAVVDADGTPFGAWTVGVVRSDVRAGPIMSSMGTSLGEVTWQQRPRVALRGGSGWAVWQGDSREVFAAAVTVPHDGGAPSATAAMSVLSVPTLARLERADVAMGDGHALVAVGQTGPSPSSNVVATRLLEGGMVRPHVDALVALASADVLVGPAVAWSGTDYVVAWSNGQQLFTQRVSPDGTKRTAPGVNVAGLTSLDVECLANGQCFVGWVGAGGATVSEVDGGVVATAPFVTGAIALSNDGVHLCGAWPDDGGFGYACVDEQHQLVDEAVVPWADAMVGDLQLSAGRPGVLAWSDGVSLWTTRVGEVPTLLGQGFAPAVATELDGNGARGVVVATRFDAEFSLRAFMRGVAWPDDAGVAVDGGGHDAGREDAGREDAGREDAGLDAGDAGTTHIDFTTSGCATGGPALLWFVLLPLTLALRSGERAGVRGRTSSE